MKLTLDLYLRLYPRPPHAERVEERNRKIREASTISDKIAVYRYLLNKEN